MGKTFQLLWVFPLLAVLGCNSNNENIERLHQKVDSLEIQNDSLRQLLGPESVRSNPTEGPRWYYPETDSRKLLEMGVDDPEAYIAEALRERTDLIPMKAVLGGTMHFSNIQILGSKWLIADFEDGHVYGKGLFEYSVDSNEKLHFKIIALSEN